MIRITREYVTINAKILEATQKSVDATLGLERLAIAQHLDQLQQRIGPILGCIEEQRIQLNMFRSKIRQIGKNRHVFQTTPDVNTTELGFAIRTTAGLSHLAYVLLASAHEQILEIGFELRETRNRIAEASIAELAGIERDANAAILPLINNADGLLIQASEKLTKLLSASGYLQS